MFYETREVLIGFRLKLTFDSALHKENSSIFVDVLKTPTVGLLLNSIIERFELPPSSFLLLQDCKLLHSESIYVLTDANSVEVTVSSASENVNENSNMNLCAPKVPSVDWKSNSSESGVCYSHKIVAPSVSENVNEKSSVNFCSSQVPLDDCKSISVEDGEPLSGSDVIDGKSKNSHKLRGPKKKKLYPCQGVAYAIQRLLQEEEINSIDKQYSTMSVSNDPSNIKKTKLGYEPPSIEEVRGTSVQCEETSDLNSDVFDCSDLNLDKKKRKRKRKHSKKISEVQHLPSPVEEPINKSLRTTKNIPRQHIHFNDIDVNESLNPTNTMETDDKIDPETNTSTDECVVLHETTRTRDQQPVPTSTITCAKPKASQYPEMSYARPKSSLSAYTRKTTNENNVTNDDHKRSSETLFFSIKNIPKLPAAEREQNKQKCDQVRKELSTLLMCKQLDTCMQYDVQFANEKGDFSKQSQSPSPLKKIDAGSVRSSPITRQSSSDQLNQSQDFRSPINSISSNVESQSHNGAEHMEESSDDCEVVKQIKIVRCHISLCRSDGTWTPLTPEVADVELEKLETPKENQSIVFRIVYLNRLFNPVVSHFLYGRVVCYKPDSNVIAVDIPTAFIQRISLDCDELPEALVQITGSTYQIHLSALVEPKVIT